MLLLEQEVLKIDPLTDNASDMQDKRQTIRSRSTDWASSRSTLLGSSEHQENMPESPETETGVDGEDGRFDHRSSDDRESTHSTYSEAKDTETPLSPQTSSEARTRRTLPDKMAEDCRDIMTVDPKDGDIVVP